MSYTSPCTNRRLTRWGGLNALAVFVPLLVMVLGCCLACLPLPFGKAAVSPLSQSLGLSALPMPLNQALCKTWYAYKYKFIQGDGRVIDHKAKAVTTSEGQAYAMLRAVWVNDKATFDTVWRWTQDNLRQRNDALLAWQWGQAGEQSPPKNPNLAPWAWGMLDATSASDADIDAALALLLAYQRWGDVAYLNQAKAMAQGIWQTQVVSSQVGPVLLAGDWYTAHQAANNGAMPDWVTLNPSYFAPYAYREFAKLDPDPTHDWLGLANTSYTLLRGLLKQSPTGLYPDWVDFRRSTGEFRWVSQADPANKRNDFGYDAIRVYWRLSVDALVYHQQQAWPLLTPGLKTLEQYVAAKKRLPGPLSYTGGERALLDSEALVGTLYPLALAKQPAFGQQLGQQWVAGHLAPYLLWLPDTDYYANNWYWFGLALALYPYQPAVVPKGGSPLLGVGANCQ